MNRFRGPGIDLGCHCQPSKQYSQPTSAPKRVREPSDPVEMIKFLCHGPFFGVGGSGRRPSRMCKLGMGARGAQNVAFWGRAQTAGMDFSLVCSSSVPGFSPGVVPPWRHFFATLPIHVAPSFCARLQMAVSLGPPEGATTHYVVGAEPAFRACLTASSCGVPFRLF